MPKFWNTTNKIAVMVEELVPEFWMNKNILSNYISKNRNSVYGIRVLQRGCRNRKLIIDFDSLPKHIQEALGDPRKCRYDINKLYETNYIAEKFYKDFCRPDGSKLCDNEIRRYIINASVLDMLIGIRNNLYSLRKECNFSIKIIDELLLQESKSINNWLKLNDLKEHNLPLNKIRFRETLKKYQKGEINIQMVYKFNFSSLINDIEGKRKENGRKNIKKLTKDAEILEQYK